MFSESRYALISKITGYALLSKRDLSAVGDVASEVRAMLGTDDLSKATLDHVHSAIYDFLLPSDKTFLEGMAAARQTCRKSFPKTARALPEEPAPEIAPEDAPREIGGASPPALCRPAGVGDKPAHGKIIHKPPFYLLIEPKPAF